MRTVRTKVYTFNELSQEAKEIAIENYRKDMDVYLDCFNDNAEEQIEKAGFYDEIKLQYSLSYCQGDGFNLYNTINFNDLLNKIKGYFTEEEQTKLKEYFNSYDEYKLEENNRYAYCIIDRQNIVELLLDALEDEEVIYNQELVQKFKEVSTNYLCKLCKEFEKNGYEYFYEVSEETMAEMCEANEYEFDIDGKIA